MSNFNHYAQYYDLIYKEKDYEQEVDYINTLIRKYTNDSKSILELGCGTGKHAAYLSKKGFSIYGVDLSDNMVREARSYINKENIRNVELFSGDIRSIRLEKEFDVVISLFHVMSYQTDQKDLEAAFTTANLHLKNEGIFIFDCWNGPAVLSLKPETRVKRLENNNIKITRIAEPIMYPNNNIVDVNYEIFIQNKKNNSFEKINEVHKMRYFFEHELNNIASKYGFEKISVQEFLTTKKLDFNSWNACYVYKKREEIER